MESKFLPTWVVIGFIVISFVGFLDAGYLTIQHYRDEIPPCSVLEGCEEVTTSEFSTIAGIPVSLMGVLYYLLVLFMSLWYFDRHNKLFLDIIPFVTFLGVLASAWFVYLQIVVIKAICLYCMFSALTSALLFVLGVFVYNKKKAYN